MTVHDAHQALRDADAAVAKAKADRDEAVNTLERVLAEIGWTRVARRVQQHRARVVQERAVPGRDVGHREAAEGAQAATEGRGMSCSIEIPHRYRDKSLVESPAMPGIWPDPRTARSCGSW
jgi:hypothetical protein